MLLGGGNDRVGAFSILVAIIDGLSRAVLTGRPSNTVEVDPIIREERHSLVVGDGDQRNVAELLIA
jgi:hypothetical protein